MKPERWKQIEEIYDDALKLDAERRTSFLDRVCNGDLELRCEVEELLSSDRQAGSFLAVPAIERAAKELAEAAAASSFIGRQIGHYQVLSLLGAGGMGEVYLARDARLDRKVAVKYLPALLAQHPDRLRRFEREARASSALNHPNVLTVYDIGEYEGFPYIVAELLEGEELRAQLKHGSLPVRRAMDYAQQIAQGLAAAHEKGVIHRDLKPENLFVINDGRVKILDFGLAKLKPQAGEPVDSRAATQTQLTDPGTVMGTVSYMAPEQVRGQEADHRADIFAFGVILYEMLAGKGAFNGASTADLMSAILKEEPSDLRQANAKISPALEKIVRRCLEKRPERRFQSASDLGFALEAVPAPLDLGGSSSASLTTSKVASVRSAGRERALTIATGVLALLALALGVAYFNRSPANARLIRLAFVPPKNLVFDNGYDDSLIISPDGQKLAFTGRSADGKRQLWVRPLGATQAQLLPDTEDALLPFWSPDSSSLGFSARGKLKRIELAGGRAQTLCNIFEFRGGTWNRAGVILFANNFGGGLFQIPAAGGEVKQVTSRDPARGERSLLYPYFLPDGRRFLYRVVGTDSSHRIFAGSLDSKEAKQLLTGAAPAIYAPPGWLLFVRDGAVLAQAFDAARLELKGEAFFLTPPINTPNVFGVPLSVSENGVLVWQGDRHREYQLTWFDRVGNQVGVVGAPMMEGGGQAPRLAPNGKRIVIGRYDAQVQNADVWAIDLQRNLPTRLTSHPTADDFPIWSPDSSQIVFQANRGGVPGLYRKAANGMGDEKLLLEGVSAVTDWSLDGRFIFYFPSTEKLRRNAWVLPLADPTNPYPLFTAASEVRHAQLSPDGRWLAYVLDESGNYEIYVQAFTAEGKVSGDKQRISTGGGSQPRFRRDGRELFYVAADGQMMAVKKNGATFEAPKALFKTRILKGLIKPGIEYDVTADRQRFLIGTQVGDAPQVSIILNWVGLAK